MDFYSDRFSVKFIELENRIIYCDPFILLLITCPDYLILSIN